MMYPFIVYLKNKTSNQFEYKKDIRTVVRVGKKYRITFDNGKSYNYGVDNICYYPLISTQEGVRIYENGNLNKLYNTVDNYGHYLVFRNESTSSLPVENSATIEICVTKKDIKRTQTVIDYFQKILKETEGLSFDIQSKEGKDKSSSRVSSEILLNAINDIDLEESRSVLSNYIDGTNPKTSTSKLSTIYPFGCNMSQKIATETALKNSISIIEGPPGTGKTQTILNIIANLIVQNKTVAIVSNNNSAVSNIHEKLIKHGYGMIVAPLGNNKNKSLFFDNIGLQTIDKSFEISRKRLDEAFFTIRNLDIALTKCFENENRLATLRSRLSDAKIEFNHIQIEHPLNSDIKSELDHKFHRNWNLERILKLKNLLARIDFKKRLSFMNKIRFVFLYGFFDIAYLKLHSSALCSYANHKFYELYIAEIEHDISGIEDWLVNNQLKPNLKKLSMISTEIFKGFLYKRYTQLKNSKFRQGDYLKKFDNFIKYYPVVLSSTLSLKTSIPKGYLFDYLIIDESSQVDIIRASICFSCTRNAVVVGDSMQLVHIVEKQCKNIAEQLQKKNHVHPAYDYAQKNILSSLKHLYGSELKSVLLKEHYRCHPMIIGFCNKKYYNNSLTIMTHGDNHPFKIIETNISANRGRHNQRQADETNLFVRENHSDDYTKVGIIAPYRDHVLLLQKILPYGVEADTIHKYQGREKEIIIFNTVKNQIESFIDNPNLINVAVSRAIKEFIIVKPMSMKLPHGTNIGDMIRYICYNSDLEKTIVRGKICSVFDILYKEYNKILVPFRSSNKTIGGSMAEIIIYKLLMEKVLLNSNFSSIDIAREYKLQDLIRNIHDDFSFSEDEKQFIKNNSRLDFLLYSKIDKSPILAIEVDGVSFHDNDTQKERDRKKDHILKLIGLPLLRLSTDGHNEQNKIEEYLSRAMGLN